MKLLTRRKDEFVATASVFLGRKKYAPGEQISFDADDPDSVIEITEAFFMGRADPIIKGPKKCEAVRGFPLRSDDGELVDIKCGEIITLRGALIPDLLRQRKIVPVHNNFWAPYQKKVLDPQPLPGPKKKKRPWAMSWRDEHKKEAAEHPLIPGANK
jgi:hypothetical protein